MGKDIRNFDFSHEFYCCKCGNRGHAVARQRNKNRAGGHLKKMYCITCKEEVNFCECNSKYTHDDFLIEFDFGNFDQEQNRIMDYKVFFKTHENEIYERGYF